MKKAWHDLSFFRKVYLSTVALIIAIVLIAEVCEDFLPYLVEDRKNAMVKLEAMLDEYCAIEAAPASSRPSVPARPADGSAPAGLLEMLAPAPERQAWRAQAREQGYWVMDIPLVLLSSLEGRTVREAGEPWGINAAGRVSVTDLLPESDDWETEWTIAQRVLPDGRLVAVGMPEPFFFDFLEGLVWFVIIGAFSAAGCYWLSRFLSARLRVIAEATRELARGDLSVRVPTEGEGGDEISTLARSFNGMAQSMEKVIANERRLLYDISHELRSPLTRMRLALDLLERVGPEEAGRCLELLSGDTQRMSVMVEGIMEQGRGASTLTELVLESVDMRELLAESAELADFEFARNGKGARCFLRCDFTVPARLRGNRALLEQALHNILSNAMRYTPAEGKVDVSAELLDWQAVGAAVAGENGSGPRRWIRIRVRDYGPGVPPGSLEDLFRPFFRVETARDKASGGVGLGLALTRNYVERHGGSVSASNAEPGLAVIVLLPLREEA